MEKAYSVGQTVEFDVYDTTVRGRITNFEGDSLEIRAFKGSEVENVGKITGLLKSHPHRLIG